MQTDDAPESHSTQIWFGEVVAYFGLIFKYISTVYLSYAQGHFCILVILDTFVKNALKFGHICQSLQLM
jgi:hypothetical protein